MATLTEVEMRKTTLVGRFLISFLTVIFILTICIGCAVGNQPMPTQPPTDGEPIKKESDVITPSLTYTPTLAPSETDEILRQLSKKEKETIAAKLVQTNNQCILPCLMGIKLHETTLDDAQALLAPSLGPGLVTRNEQTNEVVYNTTFETGNLILGGLSTHFSKGRADGINFQLGGLWRADVSMRAWTPYTLEGIFSQLGLPSRILFKYHGPPNEPSASEQGMIVSYYLYYESIDMIIAYNGQKTEDVPKFHFCPMQQKPEFIGISIGWYAKDIPIAGTDLQDASNYTVEDFFNLDWGNPDTCIDLDTAALKAQP
ncbi:hypothetical protein [Levilinea saccharolytica]|nr:hypothetical protein [Levilinea saccharolytica]